MASRPASRPVVMVCLAVLVALLAYLGMNRFLAKPPELPSIIVPAHFESDTERTTRQGHEQSAKDWKAAQKRADSRNADARAKHLAPDTTATNP